MPPRKQIDLVALRRMYDDGLSVKHIAHALGVARLVINARLKEMGLPIRGRHESALLRMARLTPQQRLALSAPAHEARRGRKAGIQELLARAVRVQINAKMSTHEREVYDQMAHLGLNLTPSLAAYTYNLDLGHAAAKVAIEVHCDWHTSERKALADAKKLNYLLAAGWMVFYVYAETFDESWAQSIASAIKIRNKALGFV